MTTNWTAPNLASRTFLRLCQQAVTGLASPGAAPLDAATSAGYAAA